MALWDLSCSTHFKTFMSLCSAVDIYDMFKRPNINTLKEAIKKLSHSENGESEKHGLKLQIHAVIQRSMESIIINGLYTESMKDAEYEELIKFQSPYEFRTH